MKKQLFVILLCLACGLFSCTQTEPSTTTKELTPNEIAEEIHTISRSGLRGNSEMLMKYVEMIDDHNVGIVVEAYRNTYNQLTIFNQQTIFSAIIRNMFISADTRVKALKHVKDIFLQSHQRVGIYTDDINKLLEEHIDYERNKFGRMNSKNINNDIRIIYYRYNSTLQENTLYPTNGKIDDEFKQGNYLGDCWLIAAIKSLSVSPQGQKMLDEIMSVDKKGNVTVELKGVDKKYTISKEELEGTHELAQGDLDVRAIEIAMKRYLHETGNNTNMFQKIKNRFSGAKLHSRDYSMNRGMYNLGSFYNILFGKKMFSNTKPSNETIENIRNGNYSTIVSSWNRYKLEGFAKHHVYAVTGADDTYVYLSDPYNPDINLPMTHEDFLKFFNKSYSTKL